MADIEQTNLTTLTVDLLSAYFANNTIDSAQLAGLISSTHEALKKIEEGSPEAPAEPEHKPAVTARKSLASKDHIISMIDGKPYKMLKRHLATNGLTPAEYRQRYNLPSDYPMVAPTYAEQRREVAAKIGLGSKTNRKTSTTKTAPAPAPAEVKAPEVKAAAKPAAKAKAKTAAAPKVAKPRKAAAPKSVATTTEPAPGASVETPAAAPAEKPARTPRAAAKPAAAAKAPTKRGPRKAPESAPAAEPTEA